jgi:hypothetical protein
MKLTKAFFKPDREKVSWFLSLVVILFLAGALSGLTATPLWIVSNAALVLLTLPVVILFILIYLVGGPLFAAFGGDLNYFIDWVLPIWAIGLGIVIGILITSVYLYILACLVVAYKHKKLARS